MRKSAGNTEHGAERNPIAESEYRAVSHPSRHGAQGAMLSAQKVVREVQRSQKIQATAHDADNGERVVVHDASIEARELTIV
jgi:peptide deformylase